ncbi:E3 ubiquitin-protein ligase TRIM33-like isoform X2 [Dendronephthya gigantea]|uniref:E3 ubiquitin-protein ligase TRIM33-like isoform X2 n=1 Tax=Dendronephthya gigantea TaxID=151771 RepID=UPI00106CA5A5|nr:E3 ubiquitin-protein ligase TRIM33-like isoform X2 [Dendronephthya gigantea]
MAEGPDVSFPQLNEELLNILKCGICTKTLEEPKTLPCFHSFCQNCLARYIAKREEASKERGSENAFECPLCKTQLELKQGDDVEEIPPIYFIKNLLDILPVIQRQTQNLHCGSCKAQGSVVCRCFDCERYLCEDCLATHSKWPDFKQHVVMTLEELAKPENHRTAKKKPCCLEQGHNNKHFEFYCNTCQDLACMSCVVLDHPKPDHKYQPMDNVAEENMEALKETSVILQKTSKEVEIALQKIDAAAETLQANGKSANDMIRQQEKEISKNLTQKVEQKAAALLDKVDRQYNVVNQELIRQHDDMKAYLEKVNGSLDFAKNIMEKASNEEIILQGRALQLNAKDIKKRRPDRMKPIHDGTITYHTKIIVGNIILDDLGNVEMTDTTYKSNQRTAKTEENSVCCWEKDRVPKPHSLSLSFMKESEEREENSGMKEATFRQYEEKNSIAESIIYILHQNDKKNHESNHTRSSTQLKRIQNAVKTENRERDSERRDRIHVHRKTKKKSMELRSRENKLQPTISGCLNTRVKGKWCERWYVVKGNILYVWKTPSGTGLEETRKLLGYHVQGPEMGTIHKRIVFQLIHAGIEPVVLQTDNWENAEKWVNALRRATVLKVGPYDM